MTHSGAQHTHSNKYTHTLLVYGYLWTRSSLVSFHRKPRVHLRTFQSHSFNYTLSVKSLIALMSILIVPSSTCDTKKKKRRLEWSQFPFENSVWKLL